MVCKRASSEEPEQGFGNWLPKLIPEKVMKKLSDSV